MLCGARLKMEWKVTGGERQKGDPRMIERRKEEKREETDLGLSGPKDAMPHIQMRIRHNTYICTRSHVCMHTHALI